MATADVSGELEAIKQLKARYCRFLDTKDVAAWRDLFADDVVGTVDLAVSTGGADPQTTPRMEGVDQFASVVLAAVADAATMHHCHTPEITLTSDTTATGIWAMEDRLVYPDGRRVVGAGHYHETYEKRDGSWCIKSLHLTRTFFEMVGDMEAALPDIIKGGND
ncbi:nuclear transport factor 2 family protein [Mycobacterium sp. 21AC1]|uniref:nuclear transport factor 2 family protein n=1 Tax=[Mycobacterium] appelbergii TaxID=2939269 RepID=UPI00293906EF|nr:nuclear transport factor 2 family protein [Mycobacterium sp. 21AC1]MDV3124608.1 nuclear transport factor 2 family protein [Mycobacterium sp. 21AC1]